VNGGTGKPLPDCPAAGFVRTVPAGSSGRFGLIHHHGATGTGLVIRTTTSPGSEDATVRARRLSSAVAAGGSFQLAEVLTVSGTVERARTTVRTGGAGSTGNAPKGAWTPLAAATFTMVSQGRMPGEE
jgi:hypothetical protein